LNRYGADHKAIRRQRHLAYGQPCARGCGRILQPGDDIDLDHADDGSGRYIGWSCSKCNRAAGGRRSQQLRKARDMFERRKAMQEVAFGVEVAWDRSHTSLVAAGQADDLIFVELVAYLDGSDTAEQVAELINSREKVLAVVADENSPAESLIGKLRKARVDVTTTFRPWAACNRFQDESKAGRLRFKKHPAVEAAFRDAEVRPAAGGQALDRRKSEVDVGPAFAAVLAVWGLLSPPPIPGLFVAVTAREPSGAHVVNTPFGPQVSYPLGPPL
jgi:hypothetical protein